MADYRPYGGPHGDDATRARRYGRWAPGAPRSAPPPGPGPGPQPADRRPRRWLLVLSALVPVLALAAAAASYLSAGRSGAGEASPAAGASASASAGPSATAHAAPSDVRFVQTGECLRNEGDVSRPKFTIAPCGPQTYEVLARFDGATDGEPDAKRKCASVPGYTDWYFFKSDLNVLDYVLCLRAR